MTGRARPLSARDRDLARLAELLDRACGAAEEQTRQLAEELSALEAQIHT